MTIERVDARLCPPDRPVVNILAEVLGGPADVDGPRWVVEPARDVQRAFWRLAWPDLAEVDRVLVAAGSLTANQIQDVHGRRIPGLDGQARKTALFLIDKAPSANWGHPCVYFVLHADGSHEAVQHIWPPSASIRMVSLPRPPIRP